VDTKTQTEEINSGVPQHSGIVVVLNNISVRKRSLTASNTKK
jgi:hypothetical protein